MKILIDDGMQIQVGTGIGKYSEYLYRSLKEAESGEIQLDSYHGCEQSKLLKRLRYLLYINSSHYFKKLAQFDLVHYTNYAMPFFKNQAVKYVVTVHDLVSFLYPDSLPKLYRIYNQWTIKHALKNADSIITDSLSVKEEIKKLFPQYAFKVTAIYPGLFDEMGLCISDGTFINPKLNEITPRKYFLYVGTIEKRKNVGMVIEGFVRLKAVCREAEEFKLVLAGREGFGCEDFRNIAMRSDYGSDILFTGYTDQRDVNELYKEAAAYVFPSIYEGFGSIQIECMKHHLPLILSNIPTNREISGHYGEFFDLNDLESLVEKMKRIVRGKYDYDMKNAYADTLLAHFQWPVIAKQYKDIYEST